MASNEPNDSGLSISGWGATLKANGREVVLILFLIVGFMGIGLILRDGFAIQAQGIETRTIEHQRLLAAQDNLACVLLMPQETRNTFAGDPRKICDYLQVLRRP